MMPPGKQISSSSSTAVKLIRNTCAVQSTLMAARKNLRVMNKNNAP